MMNFEYNIINSKHDGVEKKGFILNRPNGLNGYVFIHFKTPVNIVQDNEIIQTKPDACIMYTPGSLQWYESTDCVLHHDWITFIPKDELAFCNMNFPWNQIFYPSGVYTITQRILGCQIEFINKEIFWHETISSELSILFIKLSRELANNKTENLNEYTSKMKDKFKLLRVRIYNSCQDNWDIDKMANELHLCRSRFTVLYHNFFAVPPKLDLINARLERAQYLLVSVDENIEQIAILSGYTNQYHFIRQFKLMTGITPGEYRVQKSAHI